MSIQIKSFNQILGEMIRRLVADTPINDVNVGSAVLTLLEAAAQADFENNASILNILELLSIDAIRNNDLDARAADFGLSRTPARKANGLITIKDSTISKRSTGLYQVKPAPIAGSTQIFVNDASGWSPTGNLFIGRGTQNFEGPIAYTSITNNVSFFTITLASALQKDHLISDVIVDAQGTTDRLITAGTTVQIPANNQNPVIEFKTLRDAVIPAGEDTVTGVEIVAVVAGSRSNAGLNTITNFVSPPFTGATVTNPIALTSGRDAESDDDLRERLKSYANTLARGTQAAILAAVVGISDPDDSKQVASAVLTEPPRIGDPSILYIDDGGGGFQPSFAGQSVDRLLSSATGNEEFLQLANFPLPRPQSINTEEGPFELTDGMEFRVAVDGVEESVFFNTAQFVNISAARLSEIIIAINDQSESFKATFTSSSTRMLVYPVRHDAEIIQVMPASADEDESFYANSVLKFPTNEFSYIRLYQNNNLLHERERSATLLTGEFSTWNISSAGNIIISVDGTPPQDRGFTIADFNGVAFVALTLEDWVTAFNLKFAGLTASALSSGRMQIVSNKEGAESRVDVLGGTYVDKWFANEPISAVGQNSDFQLNRQTGNMRILTEIEPGDSITAGTEDAKGSEISSSTITGNYNVSTDMDGRAAEMIVVADANSMEPRIGIGLAIGNIITITDQGSNVMRLMSDSTTSFAAAQPDDYIYIVSRGVGPWIDPANCGLFKIIGKGEHTSADVDTYIEVHNVGIVPGIHTVQASEDMQAFKSDAYPQLWKGSFTTTPAAAPIQDVVDTINDKLVNVKASIFKTSSIKVTSTTEENGSIAIPVSVGRAELLFPSNGEKESGNPSHIANRTSSKDMVGFYKRTEPTSTNADGVSGKLVWLDRVTYNDIRGQLTSSAIPGEEGVDTYSEELQSSSVLTDSNVSYDDVYNALSGANKTHYRSVRDKIAGDKIGTQFELPTTLMDYVSGDRFNLMRPVDISSEDSVVFILDQDPVAKTIDIPMSRKGRINTEFPATDFSFSADDADNEPGVNFGNLQIWGKTTNGTEFENYALWMRARNWYVSGGAGSGGGSFITRSKEYGPHGENLRFRIEYPSFANQENSISHDNTPDFTLATYTFGSDVAKSIGLTAGEQITVTSLGGDDYRYTFTGAGINLASILVGDVISMLNDSGITAANRGQFRIKAINIVGKTIDVHNPNGAATGVGTPEVTDITTIADVVGSPTVSIVSSVSNAAAINGRWFRINDSAGTVAVYYNAGTPNPGAGALGVNRVIEVGPLTGSEDANTVTALTAGVIDADPEFTATFLGTTITITNAENGAYAIATNGTTPTTFSFAGTPGTADVSINGKYFTLYDVNGSVAIWYDTTGVTPEPLHGADRAIAVDTVNAGDSANDIATKTAVFIAGDGAWASATVLANVVTVTDALNGSRPNASAGTSGFTVAEDTPGVDTAFEVVAVPTSVNIFPLLNTDVADIVAKISESPIMDAVVSDGSNPITLATRDEEYTPAGPNDYSASLSYGHDPDPSSNLNGYVSFYDGINWVKVFENTDPNFTLKTSMTLQGAAPSAYSIETAPNPDSADLGEYFKLVPVTLNNIYHHFTQKALSQLLIVAGVDITNNIRRVQVKSKLLGSQGAVEVVGGNANAAQFSIFGEAQVVPGLSKNYVEVKTPAFPVTLTKGDVVRIENTQPTKRLSRLSAGDTIDVVKGIGDDVEYRWNSKATNINQFVRFTISDVSATYGRAANTVWRWLHNDGGSEFQITALANGLPANSADDEIAAGGVDAANLHVVPVQAGSVGAPQIFKLTVSGVPTQADYFTFESASGVTFAVWFDVDGAGTPPTGATYVAATNKIEVNILSSNTEDQIVSALASTVLLNGAFTTHFSGLQEVGATFDDVVPGDLLNVYGTFSGSWSSGNKSKANGDGRIAGLPIVNVNSVARYLDVVNPDGVAMTNQAVGSTGNVEVVPTPAIYWNLKHAAKTEVVQVTLAAALGTATVTTLTQHGLREGDTFTLDDNAIAQTTTVVSVPSPTTFTFTDTTNPSGTFPATYEKGNVISSAKTVTRYRIESLGFNSLYRLVYVDGDAPGFVDCGVAIDDILTISGSTFESNNSGRFRVLGVDNTSVIFENPEAVEELNTLVDFNNLDAAANWTSNFDEITGTVGTFKNIVIGDWVKKVEDTDELYVQVIALVDNSNAPVAASLATKLLLGDVYRGTTSTSNGVSFDQNSNVDMGVYLKNIQDISFVEGDSVQISDTLFVDDIANAAWFSEQNSGSFMITQYGTNGVDYKPYVRVKNAASQNQSNRQISVSEQGFFLIEGDNSKFSSIRVVDHTVIDETNENRRAVYMTPATTVYKMSQSSGTRIVPTGKLQYNTDITTGVDGYTYYTGLLRTVQRTVDGFEPDPISYPGRRAVGGAIETLAPLIKRVKISIEVTTNEGVNLNEISDDIKSAIINHIASLGVGQDVILSEIIVKVMAITGVAAVTFTLPDPSTERVSVNDQEKAFIEPQDISVA